MNKYNLKVFFVCHFVVTLSKISKVCIYICISVGFVLFLGVANFK